VSQVILVPVNVKFAHPVPNLMIYKLLVSNVILVGSQLEVKLAKLVQQEHTHQMLALLSAYHVLVVIHQFKVRQLAYHAQLVHSQLKEQLVKLVHSTHIQLWLVLVNV